MKELKVTPIKNGTVIDHIESGRAFKILRIIGVMEEEVKSTVSVLMHVKSKSTGWKDIVKVEDRELLPSEVDKIALISSRVTINIIRNFNVEKKYRPTVPDQVIGLMKCSNPNCISNKEREPIETRFTVISKEPLRIKCYYCEREPSDIMKAII